MTLWGDIEGVQLLVDALGLKGPTKLGISEGSRRPSLPPECLSFQIPLKAHIQHCFLQGGSLQLPGQMSSPFSQVHSW